MGGRCRRPTDRHVFQQKEWIRRFEPGTCVDHSVSELSISDFVNKELIHFAVADCVRSIPSVVDGLNPCQRKILFTCLDKDVREEIRVAQLSGSVSLHSAYHHGEDSLNKAIVGMAHDFVDPTTSTCSIRRAVSEAASRAERTPPAPGTSTLA